MPVYVLVFVYFSSVASAGLGLGCMRAAKLRLPSWLGTVHGLAGLLGVGGFFVINLLQSDAGSFDNRAWWALVAFSTGLFGGLIFFRVLFRQQFSSLAVAAHGAMAALGLYLLYPVSFPAS